MAEFAKYCFNVAHSFCYSAMTYKTAWASCYYPVEWAIACMRTYDDVDKITATLTQCKKRNIKILPPDINKSELGFTVEILPDGTKAIRYGLLAIKGIGVKAIQLLVEVKKLKQFTSFKDFYDTIHDPLIFKPIIEKIALTTIAELEGATEDEILDETIENIVEEPTPTEKKVRALTNPIDKAVELALIKSGAFDEFEKNRHILLNFYNIDLRKFKEVEVLKEAEYTKQVKLEFEKALMGSYISEHPLDPFPYGDMEGANDGDIIETTGVIKKIVTKPTKSGGKFLTVDLETKDGKIRKVMIFGKLVEKYKDKIKKAEIIIVTGNINKQFNNLNCTHIKKIVGKSVINNMPNVDRSEDVQEPVVPVETYSQTIRPGLLEDAEYSPVDEMLQKYEG